MKVCVNVQSLQKSITGIERYIFEVLAALDKTAALNTGIEVEAIYPEGSTPQLPSFERVRAVEVAGWHGGSDYVTLKRYLKREGAWYVNMSNGLAVQRKSIVCFHDLRPYLHKEYDSKRDRRRFKLALNAAKVQKCPVVTTGAFVQDELLRARFAPGRISVAPCGWEHLRRIKAEDEVFGRYPQLVAGDYYYVLGSLAPHKNLRWVIEVARRQPGLTFAVAGKLWGTDEVPELPDNVCYVGYVSDGESKALMQGCRAFLHPSKYEGFGIPPLEAMACGVHVAAARGTAVELLFGSAIRYFDADDYEADVSALTSYEIDQDAYCAVMEHYSWKKSAEAWAQLFNSLA